MDSPGRAPADNRSAPVESVDRALRLLLYLRDNESISVKEAAEHLDIAASTAHRLLTTLTRRGFTVQDFSRRYWLGTAMSDISLQEITDAKLLDAAAQPLAELQERVQETVQIMVLRRGNIRFLDGLEPDALLRVARRKDSEMPAFVSAGGKAILGHMSNQEVEEIYRRGLVEWPTRRVESMKMMKRMLSQVRRLGYGLSIEETEQGVVGVGVAVIGPDSKPVAALTVAIPSVRFQREYVPEYVAALRKAASQMESALFDKNST